MPTAISLLLHIGLVALASTAAAQGWVEGCSAVEDDAERLACYDTAASLSVTDAPTLLSQRTESERSLWGNRYGIVPHRRSYLLPLTYAAETGQTALDLEDDQSLQRTEVKFQYSFKVPVASGLLLEDDQLYLAFTQLSLWQAYNRHLSSPFRETVYEPELIWSLPIGRPLLSGRLDRISLGINHQSNGRGGDFSRSWNRITAEAAWSDAQWAVGARVWHRIKESKEEDDNPDIEDYLGHGEIHFGYKWDEFRFTAMLRNNFKRRNNHSSVEIGFSWPLSQKLSGFVQFYNGYGETLVDYDQRIRRVGFGVILADWF